MPAQNVNFDSFINVVSAYRRITKIQSKALVEIAKAEISLDGGIATKHIAQTALIESVAVAAQIQTEVVNA